MRPSIVFQLMIAHCFFRKNYAIQISYTKVSTGVKLRSGRTDFFLNMTELPCLVQYMINLV